MQLPAKQLAAARRLSGSNPDLSVFKHFLQVGLQQISVVKILSINYYNLVYFVICLSTFSLA